jgi:anti-sigma factor RsiW
MTDACEKYRVLLHGHLDGELTPEEEEELRGHLTSCGKCAGAADELRNMMRDLNEMSLRFAEPHVWDEVRSRVLPSGKKQRGALAFPVMLVATMVAYKVVDISVGFRVAVLLKPLVILAVAILLFWHRQSPFHVQQTRDPDCAEASE